MVCCASTPTSAAPTSYLLSPATPSPCMSLIQRTGERVAQGDVGVGPGAIVPPAQRNRPQRAAARRLRAAGRPLRLADRRAPHAPATLETGADGDMHTLHLLPSSVEVSAQCRTPLRRNMKPRFVGAAILACKQSETRSEPCCKKFNTYSIKRRLSWWWALAAPCCWPPRWSRPFSASMFSTSDEAATMINAGARHLGPFTPGRSGTYFSYTLAGSSLGPCGGLFAVGACRGLE